MTARRNHEFDVGDLERHLERHMEDFNGPLHVQRMPGGQSNPTFELVTPTRRYALRCKPGPADRLLPSAHAIEREFRVQAALAGSEVPVPRMYYLCTDEAIIGCAFYVMEFVRGRILWDPTLPESSPAERTAFYDEMSRVIAALHRVDYQACGLTDFGKSGDYFARQIARWSRQYRAAETERIPAMDRLMEWLPEHIPLETHAPNAIVHGDFRLDNVIFHPVEPRIVAVIDWELCTLGHPIADFSYHALAWRIPRASFRGIAGIDLTSLGIPSEVEYWATYLHRTGLQLAGDRDFYFAFNLLRIVGILQGVARRVLEGTASAVDAVEVGKRARPMAELGWQFAQQSQANSSAECP